eukprot:CAMPEP_0118886782 /NCGR_PEP_ID=MMETSP1163-20130328/24749_1 /TAXON_ID=124430 /ORGANISM="Phaeomonas parva, Strain CCMP2877" /LENGTH=69 /DNA_ID=CAMNT_0006825085 /DNA_START=253 /DNA_END=462 /DNA_ORIENTATION=-
MIGMRKKLKKRLERKEQEEKEARIVAPASTNRFKNKQKPQRRRSGGGPAPDRNLKDGVMRVSNKKPRRR